MQNLIISNVKILFLKSNFKQPIKYLNQYRYIVSSSVTQIKSINQNSYLSNSSALFNPSIKKQATYNVLQMQQRSNKSLLFRSLSTNTATTDEKNNDPKKMSTMKQMYSQYGPLFIVVHLITVVLWISGFFVISKQ